MLIITCSQSSPVHSHLAAQVTRASFPVVVGPLSLHLGYFPENSHSDHLLALTNTSKWELEQTRWRPVMVTVKDALIASGTRLLTVRPPSMHFPFRCGIHCPSEKIYIMELTRGKHVSLLASTSNADLITDIGGSTSRPFVISTSWLSYASATTQFNSLLKTRIDANSNDPVIAFNVY